ncbi:hypothetical protein B296_00010269 [Ensete ventricosum]|uniref:Uncharacterized protein n=1 Tax=Ensete ventricosum TaxID=4639 RepID=A0A427AXG6_ENSVE|nr:hypothetical protein B296_00010269 [Ensete ventricosum]
MAFRSLPAEISKPTASPLPLRGTGTPLPLEIVSSSEVSLKDRLFLLELRRSKLVWVWTESRQVMTAAVERGWNTFLFRSEPRSNDLANEWSCELLINAQVSLSSESKLGFDLQNCVVSDHWSGNSSDLFLDL